jgi:hypothetical protein
MHGGSDVELRAKKLLDIGANLSPSFHLPPISISKGNPDLLVNVEPHAVAVPLDQRQGHSIRGHHHVCHDQSPASDVESVSLHTLS